MALAWLVPISAILAGIGCRKAAWLLEVLFHVPLGTSALARWIVPQRRRECTPREVRLGHPSGVRHRPAAGRAGPTGSRLGQPAAPPPVLRLARQRGIPLALVQQAGVGYAAPGTWPHAARDWRGGRLVFPHTTPDGRLVNLYGRAVGTAEQVPKAKRHDHLPGEKGYFNATALPAGNGSLWVCEGAFDALALGLGQGRPGVGLRAGCGCRRAAAVADDRPRGGAAGQAGGGAATRGVRGYKDVNEAWAAGVLAVGAGPGGCERPEDLWRAP